MSERAQPKVQDTEDIGYYEGEWYLVRERRLVALEDVAITARLLIAAMPTAGWGALADALDALDKEASDE